jgi:hypothetical protein
MWGASAVVTLIEEHELELLRVTDLDVPCILWRFNG